MVCVASLVPPGEIHTIVKWVCSITCCVPSVPAQRGCFSHRRHVIIYVRLHCPRMQTTLGLMQKCPVSFSVTGQTWGCLTRKMSLYKEMNKVKCKGDSILNGIITCFNLHMLHVMLSRDFLYHHLVAITPWISAVLYYFSVLLSVYSPICKVHRQLLALNIVLLFLVALL